MKKIIAILLIVLTMCTMATCVFAEMDTKYPTEGSKITEITGAAEKVWATVTIVVKILAFAAMLLAGLRYMFASADAKADIKKQTIILVIGAAIVFASDSILSFIKKVAEAIF